MKPIPSAHRGPPVSLALLYLKSKESSTWSTPFHSYILHMDSDMGLDPKGWPMSLVQDIYKIHVKLVNSESWPVLHVCYAAINCNGVFSNLTRTLHED